MANERIFAVHGEHGYIDADPSTGAVIAFYDRTDDNRVTTYGGTRILRFDVREYAAWGSEIVPGDQFDILLIGYWYATPDGGEAYEPASAEHRALVVADAA